MSDLDGEIKLPVISNAGPGATVVAVGIKGSEVVLTFPTAVQWAALDPQTAVNVAEAMSRCGFEIRHGRPPRENAAVLQEEIKKRATDKVREVLINRTILILTSTVGKKKLDYIAREIVDRCLQEVT